MIQKDLFKRKEKGKKEETLPSYPEATEKKTSRKAFIASIGY